MSSPVPRAHSIPLTSRYAWENNDRSRPASNQSFPGRSSKNPFFVRNAPHPSKVRHIKGLLDFPICTVLDAGYKEGIPKTSPHLATSSLQRALQRPTKYEKFIPGIGIVNTQPIWLQKLDEFTNKLGLPQQTLPPTSNLRTVSRQVKSPTEGRLQSYSRNSTKANGKGSPTEERQSRLSTRPQTRAMSNLKKMEEEFVRESCSRNNTPSVTMDHAVVRYQDNQTYVFDLLSKILQTDSLDDIKHWFQEAPEKEKEVVLEMIRAVSSTNRDFREGFDHLQRMKKNDEFEQNFFYHEDSVDVEGIRKFNEEKEKKKENFLLQTIDETINADISQDKTSKQSKRNITFLESLQTKITEDEAEIEQIRSRLASRSSVKVFKT